jgi:hypothetical protein
VSYALGVLPVDQTTYGPGRGNCFSACIASILEIPIACVPLFLGINSQSRLQRWLAARGLSATLYRSARYVPPGYSIATGASPRHVGWMHACVAYDGSVVHDPHPNRDGLPFGVEEYVVIH